MKKAPIASEQQLELPLVWPGEERCVEESAASLPKTKESLTAQLWERDNLIRAEPSLSGLGAAGDGSAMNAAIEPPWYVIRMPGGVGGGSREAFPYPD